MAVPGPPTALSDCRFEFGAPAGTPLHDFYRGGPWVPDIPVNANVPTSPPIRLAQLAGAARYQAPVISGPKNLTMAPRVGSVSATYTVTLGTGSYSVTWVKQSQTGQTISISSTTTLNPTFSRSNNNVEGEAVWQLQVNDGVTTVTYNVDVTGGSST